VKNHHGRSVRRFADTMCEMDAMRLGSLAVVALILLASCTEDGAPESPASTASGSGAGGSGQGAGSGSGGSDGGSGAAPSGCVAIDLDGPSQAVPLPNGCTGTTCTSVALTALNDLAGSDYLGVQGGLYCGTNQRPSAYEAAGVALGDAVVALDANGAPDPGGQYALVSIGMSNTTQEFSRFISKYDADPAKNPSLVLVDGALGSHATPQWIDPNNEAWTNLSMRLATRGVSDAQVVALWVKLAQQTPQAQCDAAGFPGEPCFPAHADKLAADIRTILGMLAARFTNLKLVYLSSRIYAGYATVALNPEPYAYHSGFSVKKLIIESIMDDPAASALPYLAWGPYIWADGTNANGDGLTWSVDELSATDGTHPSSTGQDKVADMLFAFFTTDTTSAPWFNAR